MNLELFKKDENKEISLTSLEIAELTGKEHRNVTRDIETYLEKVVEGGVFKFEHTYQNPQNKQFYKCYRLPKREVLILVSGYSVELRAKIIDRLEYLENELKKQSYKPLSLKDTAINEMSLKFEEEIKINVKLSNFRIKILDALGLIGVKNNDEVAIKEVKRLKEKECQ
ncbi:hypothetical protein CRT01_08850 [Campylobacter coli]|nr:hypothetical protein [Campylobacter coli]